MIDSCWLIVGGAGYIGAHVVQSLLGSGRRVIVLDDLSTGIAARLPPEVQLLHGSATDPAVVVEALRSTRPTGVMHLAAKKSPTESVSDPLTYARENVVGVINLLEAVRASGVARVVFSSSCAVYGSPDAERVDESAAMLPVNPYGESKLYAERLLESAAAAYQLGAISLRYFNVVGAAAPALADTGSSNLVPLVFSALRACSPPRVFGADYPTPDGTCIRDYVDVEDVADAHVRAAEVLERHTVNATYNVGRGEGASVLQVLDAVRAVTGLDFGHQVLPRRPGDPARIVGQVDRIARELGWSARRTLADMVASAWAADSAHHPQLVGVRPAGHDPS